MRRIAPASGPSDVRDSPTHPEPDSSDTMMRIPSIACSDLPPIVPPPGRRSKAGAVSAAIARDSALKWRFLGGIALVDAAWIAASDFHFVLASMAAPAAA